MVGSAWTRVQAIDPPREDAPKFRGKTMQGEKFDNESLKGRPALIQFWATWCKFCRMDQPAMDQVVEEYGTKGLEVLAVSMKEARKTVEKYLGQFPRKGKIVVMEDTNLGAVFGSPGLPAYVLLDSKGKIAAAWTGAGGIETLRARLGSVGL
jgi:thiol-disulfide isomerase/thioredoxin